MLRKLFLIGLVCAFLAPTNVFAEGGFQSWWKSTNGKWSITPYGGASYGVRDMVNLGSTITTQTADFSDGSSFSSGGVLSTAGDVKFEETHNTQAVAGIDFGYFILDDLEVFGGFEYVTASGNSTQPFTITNIFTFTDSAGTVTNLDSSTAKASIKLDKYNAYSFKIGATKYFPMRYLTPYIGGYGGFRHVDGMDITIQFSPAGTNSSKLKFYDPTDSGFYGFHIGVKRDWKIENMLVNFGIRAKVDYVPELNDDDTDVQKITAASEANNPDDGMDIGLTAQIGIRF